MARLDRVQVTLSPSMKLALQYMAQQEDLAESAIARRVLRAGLDRTIHSAAVQDMIRQYRAVATARQWAEMQEEAAEELVGDTRGGEVDPGNDP